MFIDYLTLMLLVLASGLATTAWFFWLGPAHATAKSFAGPMAAIGLVAVATGLHMVLTWPIPNLPSVALVWANSAFGEPMLFFGMILLATALSLAKGWDLRPVGVAAFIGGLMAITIGGHVLAQPLTMSPPLTAFGFFTAGLAGLLTPLALCMAKPAIGKLVAALLVLSSIGWIITGIGAICSHLAKWSKLPSPT